MEGSVHPSKVKPSYCLSCVHPLLSFLLGEGGLDPTDRVNFGYTVIVESERREKWNEVWYVSIVLEKGCGEREKDGIRLNCCYLKTTVRESRNYSF